MSNLKYKVGDKVRIKSLDWYNEHALIDISGVFRTSIESLCLNKKRFMGKELTICSVLSNGHYLMEETGVLRWTDEMIEGLVEEETKPIKDAIAWSEKQGKETSWKPSKEEMDVLYGLAYITNQYDEHKEEIITRLYQDLKREFFNGSSYENMFPDTEDDVRRRSTIQVLEYARSLDNYNQYGKEDIDKNIAWLEKQDKKPQGKSAPEAINEKNIDSQNYLKPTNKVEPKFKVGDKIKLTSRLLNDIFGVIGYESEGYRITNISNGLTYFMSYSIEHYYELVEEEVGLVDNLSSKWANEFNLPEGYIFKDENGNEILTSKIILEKVNALKIQSDNMETETYRGYYTTEPETTSEGKKRCVVYFWDNDFADKVELDLSGRELVQEDGKWFVVKKKKEYPKTYEECVILLGLGILNELKHCNLSYIYKKDLIVSYQKLLICRDAYWKIAGEEMGLGKPWEPDYDSGVNKYGIIYMNGVVQKSNPTTNWERHLNKVLDFPTEEMRDAFFDNFKELIEICKELL